MILKPYFMTKKKHFSICNTLYTLYIYYPPFSFVDDTHVAKEKASADAEFYKVQKEIEANAVCI